MQNITMEKQGAQYGYWTVISSIPERLIVGKKRRTFWKCKCVCGKEKLINASKLRSGTTKSCGCKRLSLMIKGGAWSRPPKHKAGKLTDLSAEALHSVWYNMKERCYNLKNIGYKDYGARGIKVCERWLQSFDSFFEDMGYKPRGMSIDRIDNNKNYEPGNCKWSTRREQRNNCRNTIFVGDEPLSIYCERLGMDRTWVYPRIKLGMSIEDAINPDIARYRKTIDDLI